MRVLAVLVVSLVALAVVEDWPQAASVSRRDGRITVIVGESGESIPSPRLFMMDADGKNLRGRGGYVTYASLSPDGRRIAYDSLAARDARVLAADAVRPRGRVLVKSGGHVDWSPNGRAIAFVRYRNGCCTRGDIWVESFTSRKQRQVVRNGDWPDWSPDGKRLAFVRSRDSDASSSSGRDIWAVDLASKRTRRLIRGADSPRWSPDGRRIAFTRWDSFDSFIYVAHADGTEPRRVVAADTAAWSPDGSELAIANFNRIVRIRPDGTHRRVVWAPKGGCPACRDLDWSR